MEFFITWAIILGLVVVPGVTNYYCNRWFMGEAAPGVGRLELAVAGLTLTFVMLVGAAFVVLLISLGWDGLRDEIADFAQGGLKGYGQNRPIALTGVLTAVSLGCTGLMALLGIFRVPSRFLR
jgi:hypothetical protein